MKVALFGGRFDPPHYGHLILARDLRESGFFDTVKFLVNYSPPHKKAEAGFSHRVRMLQLMLRGEEGITVETFEGEKGISPSYTYDVLKAYKREHPDEEVFFVVGEDQMKQIKSWKMYEKLPTLAKFVLLKRGEGNVPEDVLRTFKPLTLTARKLDISSSEIRRRLREGKSVRGLTSQEVIDYIHSHGLYTGEGDVAIYTDASAKGNPGELTIAFVVRVNGRTVYEFSKTAGYGTNNEGEYLALIEALNWAKRSGFKNFKVYTDSRLVVNQIKGVYRVKSPRIRPLYTLALGMIEELGIEILHVSREENLSDALTRFKRTGV